MYITLVITNEGQTIKYFLTRVKLYGFVVPLIVLLLRLFIAVFYEKKLKKIRDGTIVKTKETIYI
jgi:hypothetical protein